MNVYTPGSKLHAQIVSNTLLIITNDNSIPFLIKQNQQHITGLSTIGTKVMDLFKKKFEIRIIVVVTML